MLYSFRSRLNDEKIFIVLRALGVYLLCLGVYYFYNKTLPAEKRVQLGSAPYVVITLWCVWIFFHNRVLLRKFLFEKKFVAYTFSLVAGIALTAILQGKILFWIRGINNPFTDTFISVVFYTFIGAVIFLAFLYIKERKDFYQTAALKKEVELQQLKNQLNPHFLFNSLNNIYSYNLENNTYGNDLILKLSQLMRFIVESTREDSISLKEELDFIDNYLFFEKERLGYRCDIQYLKNIKFMERTIPPLLLFPFIENAFKHGSNTIRQSKIEIKLEDAENELSLEVRNEIVGMHEYSTKAGLPDAERRLELLFPGKYQLRINQDGNHYNVHLKLNLP